MGRARWSGVQLPPALQVPHQHGAETLVLTDAHLSGGDDMVAGPGVTTLRFQSVQRIYQPLLERLLGSAEVRAVDVVATHSPCLEELAEALVRRGRPLERLSVAWREDCEPEDVAPLAPLLRSAACPRVLVLQGWSTGRSVAALLQAAQESSLEGLALPRLVRGMGGLSPDRPTTTKKRKRQRS